MSWLINRVSLLICFVIFFKNQPCDVSHAVHIKKQFNIMIPPQGFGETGGGGINETRKQMLNLFLGGHGNKEEYGEQWI